MTSLTLLTAPYRTLETRMVKAISVEGIETSTEALWRSPEAVSRLNYSRSPLASITPVFLDLPATMAERVVSFYERFFVHPSPEDFYHCHRFAYWMQGAEQIKDFWESMQGLDRILQKGQRVEGGLGLGKHAVVASVSKMSLSHSVIGLGDSAPSNDLGLIHVGGTSGPLLLTSHNDAIAPYGQGVELIALPDEAVG